MKLKNTLLLNLVFILALLLRTYGINWDQNQHLHPDERFLTMVASDIALPKTIGEYFSTQTSPLNPYNYDSYKFFVYGTFPLFLVKFFAVILNIDNYDQITLLGRFLSAFIDSTNIFLIYLITRLVIKGTKNKFIPSLLYAFTVLPLQLSHFFAVDTFLNTFLLSSFVCSLYGLWPLSALAFGLALSSKITAILFLPVLLLVLISRKYEPKKLSSIVLYSFLIAFFTFRTFQPYAFVNFSINPDFVSSLKTLSNLSSPNVFFPPSVQWLSKTKLLFPFQNIIFWGLGLPLTLSIIISLTSLKNKKFPTIIIISIFWVFLLFFFQGMQFAHNMRYFLPIYPFLIIVIVFFSKNIFINRTLFFFHLIFGLSFLNIYSRPHSRIEASRLIYEQIPPSSAITNEYWDDPLPIHLPDTTPNQYQQITLSLFEPDTAEKWQYLTPILESADYFIMSSNRLWGSIPKANISYPQTSVFYQNIFDNQEPYLKIVSYPGFSLPFLDKCVYIGPSDYPYKIKNNRWFDVDQKCANPGVFFRDDTAEESFTVYDHPQVLIFKNQKLSNNF